MYHQILTTRSEGNMIIHVNQEGEVGFSLEKVHNQLLKPVCYLTLKMKSATLFKMSVTIHNISQLG